MHTKFDYDLEIPGMVMNASVMTVIRADGPDRERKSVMIKRDNMSTVFWVQQCHGGHNATKARGLMKLMGVLEDRSGKWFQANHVKEINITLADSLTRSEPGKLTEDST